jgi:hypothetical protein
VNNNGRMNHNSRKNGKAAGDAAAEWKGTNATSSVKV